MDVDVTVDELAVLIGGDLDISAGKTLTVANNGVMGLDLYGTLNIAGSLAVTPGAVTTVRATGLMVNSGSLVSDSSASARVGLAGNVRRRPGYLTRPMNRSWGSSSPSAPGVAVQPRWHDTHLVIQTASGRQAGVLSSTDWSTFNGKANSGVRLSGKGGSRRVALWSAWEVGTQPDRLHSGSPCTDRVRTRRPGGPGAAALGEGTARGRQRRKKELKT